MGCRPQRAQSQDAMLSSNQVRRTALLLLLVVGFLAIATMSHPAPQAPTLYVATNGNDGWSGRLAAPSNRRTDGPFATLARACDAALAAGKEPAIAGRPPRWRRPGCRTGAG